MPEPEESPVCDRTLVMSDMLPCCSGVLLKLIQGSLRNERVRLQPVQPNTSQNSDYQHSDCPRYKMGDRRSCAHFHEPGGDCHQQQDHRGYSDNRRPESAPISWTWPWSRDGLGGGPAAERSRVPAEGRDVPGVRVISSHAAAGYFRSERAARGGICLKADRVLPHDRTRARDDRGARGAR